MTDGKRLKVVLLGALAVAIAGAWYVGHEPGTAARAKVTRDAAGRPPRDHAEQTPPRRPATRKDASKVKKQPIRRVRNAPDREGQGRRRRDKDAKPTKKIKVPPRA